ncbi:MAG TPA: STAS domain-containing protein [Solirubrobacteraceae bacterium]|jgi:anti-anti-sigma factor|nr:STAS domain-containing protein [Solirubrobacteraceae bacterium]
MTDLAKPMRVRVPAPGISVIEIAGDITRQSDLALRDAYDRASDGAVAIILAFEELEYMNSSGIGLLVTLLVRAGRNGQRILACGLAGHYREIFELTRLDEAISIHETEHAALAAVTSATPRG